MKRTFFCLIILLLAVVPVAARTVELTLYPAKAPEPAQKYQLLPTAQEQTDVDAVPLYEKAVQSFPQNYDGDKISRWKSAPLRDLPIEQIKATLEKLSPTLQLLRQAGLSKKCNWPAVEPGSATSRLMEDLSKYRQFAFILAVQARFQIAQGKYEQALGTVATGLATATHLGQGPTIIQGMVGIATAALMCRQVEEFVQQPDAINLYWGLQDLPKPFIDLSKQLQLELDNLKKHRNPLLGKQFEKQLKPAHDRIRLLMKRLDRDVAMLQCVEAIRLYAAIHEGKLPNQLSDITELRVPDNPATRKPFVYRRTGSRAVLEAPAPKGATERDAMLYELNLKE